MRPTFLVFSVKQRASSKVWLRRQYNDPYVQKRLADPSSYRSRSAFKLLEIEDRWNFLCHRDVNSVVDLGAAPGGWSQVVAGKLGWSDISTENPRLDVGFGLKNSVLWNGSDWSSSMPSKRVNLQPKRDEIPAYDPLNIDDVEDKRGQGRGTIIAVDLLRIPPIRGVDCIQADFLSPVAERLIHEQLSVYGNLDGKVDVILSDMAANASGNPTHDIEASLDICHAVFDFASRHLQTAENIGRKRGGVLLLKHFEHPLLKEFRDQVLRPNFNFVYYLKPNSSRSESKEGYFLCQGWNGSALHPPPTSVEQFLRPRLGQE